MLIVETACSWANNCCELKGSAWNKACGFRVQKLMINSDAWGILKQLQLLKKNVNIFPQFRSSVWMILPFFWCQYCGFFRNQNAI